MRRRGDADSTGGSKPRLPVRTAALDMLARRRFSTSEIARRLAKAGYVEGEISDTIAWLSELRYVDDAAIASDIARAGAGSRHWGPGRVALKLRSRGIGRDVAAAAVAGAFVDVDVRASARAALVRRFGSPDFSEAGPRERKRASDFLYRSGFDWDTIREVLKTRSDNEA